MAQKINCSNLKAKAHVFLSTPHIHIFHYKVKNNLEKTQDLWKKVLLFDTHSTLTLIPCRVTEMGKKNLTKSSTEQKTQSEEDGSSASTPLIAQDRLRLANYAL